MDSETADTQLAPHPDSSETAGDNDKKFDPNTFFGTFLVAVVLCLVCSMIVSTAAVGLRAIQKQNEENKRKKNVLIAAGIWNDEEHTVDNIPELFESIQTVVVNLPGRSPDDPPAGTLNDEIDPQTFDQLKAAKDPALSNPIAGNNAAGDDIEDIAGIRRRERVSLAYLVKGADGNIQTIVLPVYGKGLWSTLYGYLAMEADAQTVKGITFYKDGETPGLGGEINNPKWQAQWPGKVMVDEQGQPVIEVTKPGNADDQNEVDGISGATITSTGVEKMVRYWLGNDAFGPFLHRIRNHEFADAAE